MRHRVLALLMLSPLAASWLGAAGCLSALDSSQRPGGEDGGSGAVLLDSEIRAQAEGCTPASLAQIPGRALFWEIVWYGPAGGEVWLYNTYGGECDELSAGALFDPELGSLALFYDAPPESPGCVQDLDLCEDALRTVVRLKISLAERDLTLPDLLRLDLHRATGQPDYSNVVFADQRICSTGRSEHSVARVESLELVGGDAKGVELRLSLRFPGPRDCFDAGYHLVYAEEGLLVWPHVTTRAERCGCLGPAELGVLQVDVSHSPAGPKPIRILSRLPEGEGFQLLSLPPS